ncbi:hypothetical protein ANO11243_024270 [Dothideomycetidae sp. 11243]|nr:hypothetical protein ANO11243_024270 [fungal sp. No.11243]
MYAKTLLALAFGAIAVSALPVAEAGLQTRDVQGNGNPNLLVRSSGGQPIHVHQDHTATGPNPAGSGGPTGMNLREQDAHGAHLHEQIGNIVAQENHQFSGTGGGKENTPPPSPPASRPASPAPHRQR